MKKTIIRLTENDLHRLIKETAQNLLNEWEYDEEPDYDDDVDFNTVELNINLDTNEIAYGDCPSAGTWVGVTLKVTDYHMDDNGIGYYDFGGQTGYDTGRTSMEIDDCDIESIDFAVHIDEEDNETELDVNEIQLTPEQEILLRDYAIEHDLFEQEV